MSASVSGAAVRRARVRAQGLADGPADGVVGVVERVVGIQAQDGGAGALSIRPRASGLLMGDVDQALAERSIVLTWTLRGTRHYHAAADVRWLVGLFGPTFGRPGRRARQLGSSASTVRLGTKRCRPCAGRWRTRAR